MVAVRLANIRLPTLRVTPYPRRRIAPPRPSGLSACRRGRRSDRFGPVARTFRSDKQLRLTGHDSSTVVDVPLVGLPVDEDLVHAFLASTGEQGRPLWLGRRDWSGDEH